MPTAAEAAQFGPWVFVLMAVLSLGAGLGKILIDLWGKQQLAAESREAARVLAAEAREVQRYTERQAMSERMMTVIESNTAAMMALREQGTQTAQNLGQHDGRVVGLGEMINRTDQRTERMERTLNEVHGAVGRAAKLP